MKVLVTGGAGFVGSHLCDALIARGDDVTCVDNYLTGDPENVAHHSSLQVIFMTQSLERAGDHAKNLAEEVCHFVSGRSIRHLLMDYDKPKEQMFIEWLRHKEEKSQ